MPPYSTIGEVILRQSDAPEDPSTWRFNSEDEMYENVVTVWFQQDITEGKLFYRHIGPHNTKTIMDQFVFRVQDDNDPPKPIRWELFHHQSSPHWWYPPRALSWDHSSSDRSWVPSHLFPKEVLALHRLRLGRQGLEIHNYPATHWHRWEQPWHSRKHRFNGESKLRKSPSSLRHR